VRKLALLLVIGSCLSVPAVADDLIQVQGFTLSGMTNTFEIQPFNPSLGTLDSVNVTIDGEITGTILTLPNLVPDGAGGFIPMGLPYIATISQNFAGSPFSFSSQAMIIATSAGLGEGDPIALLFDYGFTFGSLSNLTGFTTTSGGISGGTTSLPPVLIDGTLNGWESSILPLIIEIPYVTASVTGGAEPVIPDLSENGALIVQYNYETPTPVSTPEPRTLSLMACGLAGLLLASRRKFAV
jgi:hypothetical protein